MKIEHLYYILVIANTGSINKAAQKLFISQQHLSRIVTTLEDDLRVKLLHRTPGGIELTEKGKIFSQYAEKIVNEYREMHSYFYLDALPNLEQTTDLQGSCKIAFPFFFSMYLNHFLKGLHKIHPGITLRYYEDSEKCTVETLRKSQMMHVVVEAEDLISELLQKDAGLTAYFIGDTSVSVCVNRNSPLAEKVVLTQADIDTQVVTCYPQNTSNILLQNADILFASSNIQQHLDSVVNNNSICIVASYIQPGVERLYPDIVLLPFERQFRVPIYIIHDSELVLSNSDKAVLQYAAQYMQKLNKNTNPFANL